MHYTLSLIHNALSLIHKMHSAGKWDSFRRQVAASLNYGCSGMPYWSEDIGGFFRPKDQYTSTDYHDLLVRWFQFGAFTPIYRVHGGGSNTELWNYGPGVESRTNATNNLRYRLLPYTYSGFYRVEMEGYSMQRAMALDFASDPAVLELGDQFMWGPSLLVAPVVTAVDNANHSRQVYLPRTPNGWVQFWSGLNQSNQSNAGGWVTAAAPIEETPLFVRAGSVLLMGPLVQNTKAPVDPTEVRVYGADAEFALFEDDGTSQDYRSNGFIGMSTIIFTYSASAGTLTIGARKGSFDGMLVKRTFDVVFVRSGHGVGLMPTVPPDHSVPYNGTAVVVTIVPR
jgi:alpha-D-xyloside xylohydrolase